MVRCTRDPYFFEKSFNEGFDIISSYNFVEVEYPTGSYTKRIKDSLKDFNECDNDEQDLERKVKSVKASSHKSSKRK